jgi:hypothetical protein
MKTTRAFGVLAIAALSLCFSFAASDASAAVSPTPQSPPPSPLPPPGIGFSVYGDSLVYRSGWDCGGGMTATECDDLRADASFVSHPPARSRYTYNLHTFDGVGGSTCLPRSGDPGLLARLHWSHDDYVAVLIGINDVNSAGRSVADTAACLEAAWTRIADVMGATPVAITYPPFSRSIWGISDAAALQNRAALNAAIVQAVTHFNRSRTVRPAKLVRFDRVYGYDPTSGVDTFDGVHPNPDGAELLGPAFFLGLGSLVTTF